MNIVTATPATPLITPRERRALAFSFSPGWVCVLLAAVIFAAFPWVFLGTESFFYRDFGVLAYPFAAYQHDSFWRGELPLWNPYSHCGVPFLAQWGTNLYPLSLIYLIFPLPWSLNYFCLAHLLLAGLGMYWLARRWTGEPYAASVATVVYVANGVMLSAHIWPNYLAALGWMPWVVGCVQQSWRVGGRWLVTGALAAAMQMVCGVPELILFTWLVLGVFWIAEWVPRSAARGPIIRRFLLVVGLVAGLTAVQLLPFFDLLAHSQRDAGFGTAKWAMPAWGWANLLVPLFHYFETPQGPWFQAGQEFLNSYYLGVVVLVVSVWAIARVREPGVWLLGGLAGFSLLMALGDNGPLFGWIKAAIPVLGVARYPIKFVLLAAFAVPLLAAWAIRELQCPAPARLQSANEVKAFKESRPTEEGTECSERLKLQTPASSNGQRARGMQWLVGLGLLSLALMALALWQARAHPLPYDQWQATLNNGLGRAALLAVGLGIIGALGRRGTAGRKTALQLALLAVLVLDALTHLPVRVPTLPVDAFAPGLWQQQNELSPPRLGESRALITPAAEKQLLHSQVPSHLQDFLGKRLAAWSNLNLLDAVPKVNGAATLQVREQKQVEQLIYGATNELPAGLLDFLAVARASAPDNPVEWMARSNACPLITAGQQPVFADGAATLAALADARFNPRAVVYLPLENRSAVSVSNAAPCVIHSSRIAPQHLEADLEAAGPSLVVIAQTFYHPWQARVDGQPTPIWRANHAFQALQVPAGRHRVELVYRDAKLMLGGGISALTLLGCVGLWWQPRRPMSNSRWRK